MQKIDVDVWNDVIIHFEIDSKEISHENANKKKYAEI